MPWNRSKENHSMFFRETWKNELQTNRNAMFKISAYFSIVQISHEKKEQSPFFKIQTIDKHASNKRSNP